MVSQCGIRAQGPSRTCTRVKKKKKLYVNNDIQDGITTVIDKKTLNAAIIAPYHQHSFLIVRVGVHVQGPKGGGGFL